MYAIRSYYVSYQRVVGELHGEPSLISTTRGSRSKREPAIRDGFAIVTFGWLVFALFGAIPFTLSGAIPSYLDAVFETMSGFTTTGATILTNVEILPRSLLFWRAATHWLGGMGRNNFV